MESTLYPGYYRQIRVRHHSKLARIEVEKEVIPLLTNPDLRNHIIEKLFELKNKGLKIISSCILINYKSQTPEI